MKTERAINAPPGAYFSRGEDGRPVFCFIMDPSSMIGPRPATAADQEAHPEAWRYFCEDEGVSPLDRDAKDGAGGSLPQPKAGRSRRKKVTNEPPNDHPEGL